ncbi:hypothetical protein [Falsibacillus albus]|uniref:GIY-YIG domain-containing protein n=1 Tax=Falsibacillus albus TaxID=2478915 RepID=A0A3L7JIK2_9BACI|nr:hypothetical protein [Falsibacillus albus]RLQ89999.1 hypothetical protein D9X91_21950 [Falsibacillus albus]
MLPTKKQLVQHLSDKMTNQDISNIYNVSFQKIQQLIKNHGLSQKELRKENLFIVYEHWLDGEVVYVGSGVWYRCRRYTNRRNSDHRQLMKDGKIKYKFVREFDREEEARSFEFMLIRHYKQIGQAKFNKQTR